MLPNSSTKGWWSIFITSLNTLISLTPSILFKSGVSKTINKALGKISSDTLSTVTIY